MKASWLNSAQEVLDFGDVVDGMFLFERIVPFHYQLLSCGH